MSAHGEKYLLNRKGYWHYHRRVPGRFSSVDNRRFVRLGLMTRSLKVAKLRRNALLHSDDMYWEALASRYSSETRDIKNKNTHIESVYRSSIEHALGIGHSYIENPRPEPLEAVRAFKVPTNISEVFKLYVKEMAFNEWYKKSQGQRQDWKKSYKGSLQYFMDVFGDINIEDLTRSHALIYRAWWIERMKANDSGPALAIPSTANKLQIPSKLTRYSNAQ